MTSTLEEIGVPELEWTSQAAHDCAAFLQKKIADAFALPTWALHAPPAEVERLRREAFARTEAMRRQLVALYEAHTRPRILIPATHPILDQTTKKPPAP